MRKQKLVLVGNGMAGLRCIENILKNNSTLYDITIFGSEPHVNYSRIKLSSVLQGDTSLEDITINDRNWYEENHIQLYTGETVIDIDKQNKKVKTNKGTEVTYDKLILATGSNPIMLPLPGVDKEGVISFRTIEDCQKMIDAAKHHKKAIVIGGGLLGLEAARGLLNLGMRVDVVHLTDLLMNKQLDQTAAKMLQNELERQGMNFLLEKVSKEIIGDKRVEGIRFEDGTFAEADLIVMAVGVKPNTELANTAEIETNRGIVVNDFLETNVPDIYAIGECAEHKGVVYGLVKPLYEQGAVLANHLCKTNTSGYEGSVLSTQLKISGVDVFSVGQFEADDNTKTIHMHDEITSTYKKIFFKDNKAVGAVLYGDTKQGPQLLELIVKRKFIPDKEKSDLLKPIDPRESYAATLPRNEFVCTCNNVSKGVIIDNVLEHDLKTVKEVQSCTKASSSCGGCKPVVGELLEYIYSDYFNESTKQTTFCSCTTLTEDAIVAEIQMQKLTSLPEIMDTLGWKNDQGCSTCRPALEYYLGMIYPEYDQSQQTLYLNEKMNALFRKDGTYSIVPQLYGGIVKPRDLRKIADVADKYDLSHLAITSDQRIHLQGLKKEQLSPVWADLNMQLHSVSANSVHSVKTTNNDHLCECDKQPAVEMAESLEKRTEFMKAPYRIRMGISACMHNGAGSTTKDIGMIKINRGWEIYVGGSSGRNARSGQLLCVAETKEEAIRFVLGFIQYYRESANFLERTWQWIDKVTLVHIREVLFNEEYLHYLVDSLQKDLMQRKNLLEVVQKVVK
ncbi:nitrite reductase large subunit NirB [Aquibacillus albus]|uniref:Nitrite reductase (NADH) large subunit n=1 Tax=Aquibacillus albus TaxID=1168171 RepID=A0ABS2N4Y6_9BACI|nr:nitrite reductase large subunit NirB [Aquibacillus albus]MBM7573205.1 nitrite reductase (NADH) large subunit [Aquibacillus albus]